MRCATAMASTNCPVCGTIVPGFAKFCAGCGKKVGVEGFDGRSEPTLNSDLGDLPAMPPRAAITDAREDFYELAIGGKGRDYYLPRFDRFDREGTSFGWHWPAFFITFWWLLYRKMWGKALLYFVLTNVISALAAGLTKVKPGFGLLVQGIYLLGLFLIPPLISNGGYYRHCQKIIASARGTSSNPQVQFAALAKRGGTSNVAIVIVAVLVTAAMIGVLAAIAIPAYQDYKVRARSVVALGYGKEVAARVGSFYESRQALPRSLADVGFGPPFPNGLHDVQLNTSNGTLRLVLSDIAVGGHTFQLIPSADGRGRVSWQCQAGDMRPSLLPAECRR